MKKLFYLVLLVSLFWSCSENLLSDFRYNSEITETQSINLSTQTTLILYNTNGNVTITGSDTTSSINYTIKKRVESKISENDAQTHLSDIIVDIVQTSGTVKFEVDHSNNSDRNYQVNFDIVLPNNLIFDIANGNGNVSMGSITKKTKVNLGNGNLTAELVLPDSSDVTLLVGNGNLYLTIPDSTNAGVYAAVGNGNISYEGLNFTNQQLSNNMFSGTLGDGSGNLFLTTGNGNIRMAGK